eukprot:7155706-Pyramimonas_sp.AAC.1
MVTVNNTAFVFGGAKKDKTYLAETWKLTAEGTRYSFRSRVGVVGGPLKKKMTMMLLVNTASLIELGLMRPDCHDMLFLSEEGEHIKHWTDPLPGCGKTDTIVWVHAPQAEAFYMYYAAPGAELSHEADPADIFSLYDGFEGEVYEQVGGFWSLDDTCDTLQFPAGDAHAFYTSDDVALTGKRSLKVDTMETKGGSIHWDVAQHLSYGEGYVLKAYLYDAGCDGAHWITPLFENCRDLGNDKSASPVKNALGINTCSVLAKYAQAYPWASTHINRTVGWHSLAFYQTDNTLVLTVDEEEVLHVPALSSAIGNILIHGGMDAASGEAPAYWDSVFVTPYDASVSLELDDAVEPVEYLRDDGGSGVRWTPVHAAGPPARQAHSAVAYGDAFYIYGGERSAYEYSDIWRFDVDSERWSFVSPRNDTAPRRHDHSAVVYGDAMFVYGGRGPRPLGDFWMFDFNAQEWTEMPSSPAMAARFGHTAVVIGDAMLVYGGYVHAAGLTDELWSFSFSDMEWTLVGPRASNFDEAGATPQVADPFDAILFPAEIPAARFAHVAAAVGSDMVIYGGAGGATMKAPLGDIWRFRTDVKEWE